MSSASPSNDRPLPPAWREEWSRDLAMPLAGSEAAISISMLVFRLGAEWFSLPATTVVEISKPVAIHRVPHRPGAGVINVQGRVTVCASLTPFLAPLGNEAEPAQARLIVLRHGDWIFATRVDAVDAVRRLNLHDLAPPPPPSGGHRFTSGLWTANGHSVGRLDEQRLFTAIREALA